MLSQVSRAYWCKPRKERTKWRSYAPLTRDREILDSLSIVLTFMDGFRRSGQWNLPWMRLGLPQEHHPSHLPPLDLSAACWSTLKCQSLGLDEDMQARSSTNCLWMLSGYVTVFLACPLLRMALWVPHQADSTETDSGASKALRSTELSKMISVFQT